MSDEKLERPQRLDEDVVPQNAIVGRRLQQRHLTKIGDEVRYYFEAFFDSRLEENLSVDLLGEDGNAKASRRLQATATPIARKDFEKAGAKEAFVGWAGLRRKTLPVRHRVIRTPIVEGDNPNPLHCDILRDNFRQKDQARALAYELCFHAESDNLYIPPQA